MDTEVTKNQIIGMLDDQISAKKQEIATLQEQLNTLLLHKKAITVFEGPVPEAVEIIKIT